jgi:hypothetical protein
MSASRGSRLWLAAFILLCLAGTIGRTWQMRPWGDALSGVDRFSEANGLRAVDGFRAQGLWHDDGLPNMLFGPRYPNDGFVISVGEERLHTVTPSGVYTHYPPGPEYLLYLAEAMVGPEPVSRLRILPLALSGAAAVFYGLSLRRRFGVVAASLVMLASLAVVPFTDANSSIHEYGYALALLLVEIGVALGRSSLRWPFVLIGFAQGWLSFDQVFLVVLTPLAVELSLPLICPGYKARLRLAIERCVLAVAGFTLASHLLHFAEVSAFYGSVGAAFADMQDSARWRAGFDKANGSGVSMLSTLLHYIVSRRPFAFHANHHSFRFLGFTLGVLWPLVAIVIYGAEIMRGRRGLQALGLLRRWFLIGLIGLVASCVWYVAMPAHAHVHEHLLYRHLILCFELWAIFLAVLAAGPIERWIAGAWPNAGIGARSALAGEAAKSEVM